MGKLDGRVAVANAGITALGPGLSGTRSSTL